MALKGHAIPTLLTDAAKWITAQEHGALGYFDAMNFEAIPKEWNPEKAKRLQTAGFAFLQLPDGSLLALLEKAVVLIGSEGEARTVANSLEEFLLLWSKGETEIFELDDEDGTAGRKKFAAWLKTNKVKAPKAKDFDFESWLDGEPAPEAAKPVSKAKPKTKASPALAEFGPKLRALVDIMGQRADSKPVIDYFAKTLGKKLPATTSDRSDSVNIDAPKVGLELVLTHDVLNSNYPLVNKTKTTFIPYVVHAWVNEKFPEPVLGLAIAKATEAEVRAKLGEPTGMQRLIVTEKTATIPFWTRDLGNDVELEISFRKRLRVELSVRRARHLEQFPSVSTALFVGYAAVRGLLDESQPQLKEHAALLADVKKRKKPGSELLETAMPRGLWNTHLKDEEGLRNEVHKWLHNIGGGWITADLKKIFGARPGQYGHDEPKLDADTWEAVDKAAKVFDARFEKWIR